jgi:thioredoxin reductase/bacterioferritin-associated ferredoxin
VSDFDLVVIGAGPAGANAALEACRQGLRCLLVDEAPAAGGQVWRAPPGGFVRRKADADAKAGDRLRVELAASEVSTAFDHRVWLITERFRIDALGPEGPVTWRTPAIVAASGATERVIPFPGWTEPGVIGLAGATILLKAQQVLPGGRALVGGCGPLLAAVAAGVLKAGGEVAAVVDLADRREWLAALPAMLARPDQLVRGLGWLARLRRRGVPIHHRHAIRRVARGDGRLAVAIAPVDATGRFVAGAGERVLEVDWVAVGHGLVPGTEITRLLGAEHRYDPELGGWVAACDDAGRTSVPGLLVAGDGGGIRGVIAAAARGRLAGLAAAHGQGRLDRDGFEREAATVRRRLRRAERFGQASARLMALRPGQVPSIPEETVVCRCEDVTRAEIGAAIAAGAVEVNQLKAWTRCGMGPCQGRMCGEAVASLLAAARGSREAVGFWTGRAPLRPVPLDDLLGEYDYADIPLPQAAPL